MQQTTDSGYIVAGVTVSFGPAHNNACLLKLDQGGGVTWDQIYTGVHDSYLCSVDQTAHGMYIAAGTRKDTLGAGKGDMYVLRVDSVGGVLWEKTYGGILHDFGRSVEQTSDAGYIVAGLTHSFGAGESDFYLVKLAPDGSIAKDAGVVSLDAPPDTVYCDSMYGVAAIAGRPNL